MAKKKKTEDRMPSYMDGDIPTPEKEGRNDTTLLPTRGKPTSKEASPGEPGFRPPHKPKPPSKSTDFYSNPDRDLTDFQNPSIRTAKHDRDLGKDIMQGEQAPLRKEIYEGKYYKRDMLSGLNEALGGASDPTVHGQLEPAVEGKGSLVAGFGHTIPNRPDAITPDGKKIKKGVPVKIMLNNKMIDINKGNLGVPEHMAMYRENLATATTRAKANVKKWRDKGLLNRKWEYLDPKIQNLLTDMSLQLGSKLSRPASEGGWEALPKAIERRDAVAIRKHLSVKGTKGRNKIRRDSLKDLHKKRLAHGEVS